MEASVGLAEGDADPVSVYAGDVDITRSSLKLAGTKVAGEHPL